MTIDEKLEMKNYSTILIEKQPKYQHYRQTKFINTSILLVRIYYHRVTSKYLSKLDLLILLWEKLSKNK